LDHTQLHNSVTVYYTLQLTTTESLLFLWRSRLQLLQPTLVAFLAITHYLITTCWNCTILLSQSQSQSYFTTQSQSHITTDDQSVSASWFRAPSGAHDRMLITVWQLLFCRRPVKQASTSRSVSPGFKAHTDPKENNSSFYCCAA
jgi:hypothetical protein